MNPHLSPPITPDLHRSVRFVLVGLALLVVTTTPMGGALAQNPTIVRNYTPPSWQADDFQWSRDQSPNDGLDDALTAPAIDPPYRLIVNYRCCVTQDDLNGIMAIDPTLTLWQSQYLTTVVVDGVTAETILGVAQNIMALNNVVFIEKDRYTVPALDVSVPSICVRWGAVPECDGNVEDDYWLNGSGVNIAIFDTGVDNTHSGFTYTNFVAGYDAFLDTYMDPVDTNGHGTHVASIALAQQAGMLSEGVADMAGLIDVKGIPGSFTVAQRGLEAILDNRQAWNVRVVNMSFWVEGGNDDGQEPFSQLVDLGTAFGLVMVGIAGNGGPANTGFGGPGAADRCLAVAACDDRNSMRRSDDQIAVFSNRGPRTSDGDDDDIDELKPEITAPGVNIVAAAANTGAGVVSLSGTSMAAPHVSGLAALLIEQSMNATPSRGRINAESVRDLLIRSAERRGTPSQPAIDPDWNNEWGWGYINGYEACLAAESGDIDLKFASWPHNQPPTYTSWLSPDISVDATPPRVGDTTTIRVQIENTGTTTAEDVRVNFGDARLTPSIVAFHNIGTRIVDLPPGTSEVTMQWTPQNPNHRCMWVEIGYGPDTNYRSNYALHNYTVATSAATFEVRNTLTEDTSLIEFETSWEYPNDPPWTVELSPPDISMSAYDCPDDIDVVITPPPDADCGEKQMVHVTAKIADTVLGGVSIEYVVHYDDDGDVDFENFEMFADAMSGPDVFDPPSGVTPEMFHIADLDHDGDADLIDFRMFQEAFDS